MFGFKINSEYLTHGVKTAVACVLGVFATHLLGAPAGPWIVITIIVVMCAQMYVGGVFQKAYFRFLGTVIGSLIAIFTLLFFSKNSIAITIAIAATGFLFSYIAISQEKLNYLGTLGAVTTTIILLGQNPTIPFAIERFLEINIGIFIATLISQFVLPIHARIHLRREQATTLEQIRDFYLVIMDPQHGGVTDFDLADTDENIIKTLFKQRQLANESAREPFAPAFSRKQFTDLLLCEREMLRAINFMYHALSYNQHTHKILSTSSKLQDFNKSITQSLTKLATAIITNKIPPEKIRLPALSALKEETQTIIPQASQEEKIHLDGFLFSVEIFVTSLRKLAKLLNILVE